MKRIITTLSLALLFTGMLALGLISEGVKSVGQRLMPDVQAKDNNSSNAAILGTWRVNVTPTGLPPFQALITYARGGGLLESNTFLPPAAATTGHGTWVKTGGHEYVATFEKFLADNPVTPALGDPGIFRVKETILVNGDTYTGAASAEFCDLSGIQCVPAGCGTSIGTRLAAEPPACQQ